MALRSLFDEVLAPKVTEEYLQQDSKYWRLLVLHEPVAAFSLFRMKSRGRGETFDTNVAT